MNWVQELSAAPWVDRLGWTLVHFLWQGAGIAGLYAVVRGWAARRSSPNQRYLLACAALAAMVAAPFVTWSLLSPADAAPVAVQSAARVPSAAPDAGIALPAGVRAVIARRPAGSLLPWVVALWFAGAIAFCVRLLGGWAAAARMRRVHVRPAPPEWRVTLARLGARIGLARTVRLLVSAQVQVPTVIGWLRPVVLAPVGALAGLPGEQVEALLLHELAHIRRQDYLVNLLQGIAESLLFYHPAVWWVSGHIRGERELCCDDVAAAASGDVLTYARALAELESLRPAHADAVLAANGGSLAGRIARLLGHSRPEPQRTSGMGGAAAAILLAVTAWTLFGQPEAAPRFEVASIKLNTLAPGFMRLSPHPGGLTVENAPVELLIQNAYGVQAFQISGGPAWIRSEHYNIEAKTAGEVSRTQTLLMLRTLLEDRFQLKLHRETKELPVYALAVAGNGPKLPQPQEGNCVAVDTSGPPRPLGQGMRPCGTAGVAMGPSGVRMEGGKVPMAEFIRMLSMILGRPVVDRTAVTRTFDLHLVFTPDETLAGLPRPMGPGSAGPPPPDPSSPPPILVALREQLGLKLESAKGPVEVLVIDRVERPGGN